MLDLLGAAVGIVFLMAVFHVLATALATRGLNARAPLGIRLVFEFGSLRNQLDE